MAERLQGTDAPPWRARKIVLPRQPDNIQIELTDRERRCLLELLDWSVQFDGDQREELEGVRRELL